MSISQRITNLVLVSLLCFSVFVYVASAETSTQTTEQQKIATMKAQIEQMQKTLALLREAQNSGAIFPIGTKVNATALLRVRTEPSLSASVVATVPKGTAGTVIDAPKDGDNHTWYKVTYTTDDGEVTGWSVGSWLVKEGSTASDDDSNKEGLPKLLSVEENAMTVKIRFVIENPISRIAGIVSWGDGSQSIVTIDETPIVEGAYTVTHVYKKPRTYTFSISGTGEGKISREVKVQGGSSDDELSEDELPPMFESVIVDDNQVTVSLRITDAISRIIGTVSWGDGKSEIMRDEDLSSAGGYATLAHKYSSAGTYVIKIVSTGGTTSTYTVTIEGTDEDEDVSKPAIRSLTINGLTTRATFLLPSIGFKYYGVIEWGDGKKQTILDEDAREPSGSGGLGSNNDVDNRIRRTLEHTYSEPGSYTITATSILGDAISKTVKAVKP